MTSGTMKERKIPRKRVQDYKHTVSRLLLRCFKVCKQYKDMIHRTSSYRILADIINYIKGILLNDQYATQIYLSMLENKSM